MSSSVSLRISRNHAPLNLDELIESFPSNIQDAVLYKVVMLLNVVVE